MVKVSYEQKPFRREVMRTYGASVTPLPSETTAVGRKILAEHPGTTGSLGCAISEACGGRHQPGGLPLCAGVGAQPGAAPPERHRPGDQGGHGQVRHPGGHRHRLRRGRVQPGRSHLPLCGGEARGRPTTGSSPWSPPPAPASPGASSPMTSATRAWSAPWPRCTPWAPASSPRPTTPAACGTTA